MSLSKLQSFDVMEQLTAAREALASLASYLLETAKDSLLPTAREHRTLTAIVLVILGGQTYYWHKFSYWSRRNIKSPRPVPVFGNFLDFVLKCRAHLELEWPKKFGKVYGFYMGAEPRLMIADAKVLKEICIKDFASFPNHHFFNVPNRYQRHFLIAQKDDHWRGMRAIMTPTFSSGRIKAMYRILSNCADELCREHLRRLESGETEVDTRQIYSSFSMSSTLKSFYGLNLSLNPELQQQSSPNQSPKQQVTANGSSEQLTATAFARRSREAFRQDPLRFFLTNLVPKPLLDLIGYHSQSEKRVHFFAESVKRIIKQRQESKTKFNDYLQLLVEAKANAEIKRTESEKHENHHAMDIENAGIESWRPSKMTLSETEIHCQGMMLMMVATETTSTLISHAIYLLAHHQDIQERLRQELLKIASATGLDGDELDNYEGVGGSGQAAAHSKAFKYDDLISCEYLDCVISETARLMSPVLNMDRVASEDYYIQDYNVTVPKGMIVYLAYYAIHNDPDYWPEPAKFDPERFNSENKHKIVPGTYVPFGVGARACIGFRFGLAEAKVGIAKLLCEFKFEPAPNTKYPPEPVKPVNIQNDFKNLRVKVSRCQ